MSIDSVISEVSPALPCLIASVPDSQGFFPSSHSAVVVI